jgi:hypothetical protein
MLDDIQNARKIMSKLPGKLHVHVTVFRIWRMSFGIIQRIIEKEHLHLLKIFHL